MVFMQVKYFDPDGTDRVVEYEDPLCEQDPDAPPQDVEEEAYRRLDRASWWISGVGLVVIVILVVLSEL